MMSRLSICKVILCAIFFIFLFDGGLRLYRHRHFDIPIVAGPGVSRVFRMSEYGAGIEGTMADTLVFALEGKEPGGKALIMSNTHANEPEGLLAALIIIENAVVEKGTIYIIPQFNHSASRATRPGDGYPLYFEVATDWGKKKFRMGNRDASPLDQWPDPDVYIHYPDMLTMTQVEKNGKIRLTVSRVRQLLSFIDARNVNRTWPGRPNGPLMEKVTFAAMEILRREKVDIAVDVHGAETMFPVTNCIVAPDKSIKIATLASLTVKAREGFDSHVEPSPTGFRGLSHREIGDFSDTLPFLLEAPIPFLDQPTGPKTEKLLLEGKDAFLLSLSKKKKLFVPYDETGWPLDKRVGQHSSVMLEILRQYSNKFPERAIVLSDVPRYADIVKNGVGYYFHDPAKAEKGKIYLN